jgi:hypothetical protein
MSKRHVLTREERRLGGRRSAEVRRQQAQPRRWEDEFFKLVDADPVAFARRMYSLTNGAAFVKGLELATEHRKSALAARETELEQRARELAEQERRAERTAEWEELARRRYARMQAETAELERQQDELRAAIQAEAEAAGFELVEVDA